MEFTLSPDQEAIQESARRMVARDIEPVTRAHAPDKPLPKQALLQIYKAFASMGITAPRIPESEGGGGLSMLNYGLVFEQLPPALAISLLAHECTAARIFAESSPQQRERFLPDLFAGTRICCTVSMRSASAPSSPVVPSSPISPPAGLNVCCARSSAPPSRSSSIARCAASASCTTLA